MRELWSYRELVYFFAVRDLKVRYKQTVVGVGWVVITPLIAVGVFTALLGRVKEVPTDGLPYAAFAYCGLIVWLSFATGVQMAAQRFVEAPELITKVYFPRVLAPLAAILPPLVDLVISFGILAIFMAVSGIGPGVALALLPLWIVALLGISFAVGTWLCALIVQYRDVRHVLTFLMQIWLFASPVVFASSIIDGTGRWLVAANPMVGVLDGFRWSLLNAPAPPVEDLVSLLVGVFLLVSGVIYFQHVERRFADVI